MPTKDLITVPSALISPAASAELTPAMTAVLWEVAAVLDEQRVPAAVDNSVWIEVPAKRLRGPGTRPDNIWLRVCLERLTGLQISGEYRGTVWGAVLIAEWHLPAGGETVRLLIPPAAVQALRAPATFARIETEAVHRLAGPAARLYAALADRRRMRQTWWTYDLDELRAVLGVPGKYPRWNTLRQWVLLPALEGIRKFGTLDLRMTPKKTGRRVVGVRFDWKWKSLDQVRETVEECESATPYAERPPAPDAPPLIPETRQMRQDNVLAWWNGLPPSERERLEALLKEFDNPFVAGETVSNLSEIQHAAWEAAHPDRPVRDRLEWGRVDRSGERDYHG